MNSRRLIILIVAVVVGIMASASVYTYVNNVKAEAAQDTQTTTVWQVTELIPKGTSAADVIANEFIVQVEVATSTKPVTAIDDPETQIQGLVAVIDIPANVQLVEGLFVEPGVVDTGVTDRLEERGLVTMTFQVSQVNGAASMIEPGGRVNVMVVADRGDSIDESGANGESAENEAGDGAPESESSDEEDDPIADSYPQTGRYVYQYVEVLAVGTQLTSDLGAQEDEETQAAATGGSGLITIAVPPEALPFLLGIDMGSIYLSLVPQNYVPVSGLGPIDTGDNPEFATYPGERDGELTPYPDLNESFAGSTVVELTEAEDDNE